MLIVASMPQNPAPNLKAFMLWQIAIAIVVAAVSTLLLFVKLAQKLEPRAQPANAAESTPLLKTLNSSSTAASDLSRNENKQQRGGDADFHAITTRLITAISAADVAKDSQQLAAHLSELSSLFEQTQRDRAFSSGATLIANALLEFSSPAGDDGLHLLQALSERSEQQIASPAATLLHSIVPLCWTK